MITGGCLCGAVRYECDAEPLRHVYCCCRDCQRASGAGHLPIMAVPKAKFQVSGQPKTFASPGGSGAMTVRNFCAKCGSMLFGTPESAPEIVTIYVGSLDDPQLFSPQRAIYVRDKNHWDILPEGIDLIETS